MGPSSFVSHLQDVEGRGKRFKRHAHEHTEFFTKHIATLWDSLPQNAVEAKNITGEISLIHGRKVHYELLNTITQIQPLGQEVPVQQQPGVRRMCWRKCEHVLAPFLPPSLTVHCPEMGQSTSWPFRSLAVGGFFYNGPNSQVKTLQSIGI